MQTIHLTSEQFPPLLRTIRRPPRFLECAGALPPGEDYRYLCVIGSREPSEYGVETCKSLIAGLRNYPVVIVSGLALGIDSVAHVAALDNKMRTIAFPGSGLNKSVLYPHTHIALAQRIVDSGNTLLSSFKPDQTGAYWTFPSRNRLMAGSSHATLIIEGRQGSGTLLTAEYALQFDRDVLIVPGSIFSDLSYGPHKLHKDGATPVANSDEILRMLGFDIPEPDLLPRKDVRDEDTGSKDTQSTYIISSRDSSINEISCHIPNRYQDKPRNRAYDQNSSSTTNSEFQNQPSRQFQNPSPKQFQNQSPKPFQNQCNVGFQGRLSLTNSNSPDFVSPVTKSISSLTKEEAGIAKILQLSSLSASEIVQKSGLGVSSVNVILSELELKGLIIEEGAVYRWLGD